MDRDHLKRAAAERAVEFIENGMVVGLGTGSTAEFVVARLGVRVAEGLSVIAIPTSEHTADSARRLGIPLTTFAEHPRIDLAIDGADEVQRSTLHLVKWLGGALLREKIVAAAADRFVVVVDSEKLVDQLGEHAPVPVEVTQFGWQATAAALEHLGAVPTLRRHAPDGQTFITDGGNYILDCRFGRIADPAETERAINRIVGVVENGLFIGRSSAVVVAFDGHIEILTPGGESRT